MAPALTKDVVERLQEQISEGLNQIDGAPANEVQEPLRALAHRLLEIADRDAPAPAPRPIPRTPSSNKGNGGWQASAFVQSLGVANYVAAALRPPENDHFAFCKQCSREVIKQRLQEARLEGAWMALDPSYSGCCLSA